MVMQGFNIPVSSNFIYLIFFTFNKTYQGLFPRYKMTDGVVKMQIKKKCQAVCGMLCIIECLVIISKITKQDELYLPRNKL